MKNALKLGAKSIMDVLDALALRIVIDGKKIESEADEVTEAHDRLLCYSIHQICSKKLSLWKEESSRTTSHIPNQMVVKVFIIPHAPNTKREVHPGYSNYVS